MLIDGNSFEFDSVVVSDVFMIDSVNGSIYVNYGSLNDNVVSSFHLTVSVSDNSTFPATSLFVLC